MSDTIQSVENQGFACVENVFSLGEIQAITNVVEDIATGTSAHFRIRQDLFAIRCLLHEYPTLVPLVLTPALLQLVEQLQPGARLVKSIFFNKPLRANWVVNWHQDLTVNVRQRADVPDFTNWTLKEGYFAVHPPVSYLHQTLTLRLHLDACDASNGALHVVPGSHGQIRHIRAIEADFWESSNVCSVPAGGILVMRPLLWHSSRRTENDRLRRVIHLEFCAKSLPAPLQWHECIPFRESV